MPVWNPGQRDRHHDFAQAIEAGGDARLVRRRRRRVALLVGVVLFLSLGDLLVTLTLLQSTGMAEANPVAAFVMQARNPAYLILFKTGSVLLSISAILLIRDRWQGEMAAWIATCILLGLTWHWNVYANQMTKFDGTMALIEAQKSEGWQMWWHPHSR